ncbi:hypothetical protein F4Y19_00705 [Candidatus Poribacteria bacterium]|nr:hypothetical protein [Candidatus Poribacteria bacterium]
MRSWIRIAHRGASGRAPENTLAAFKSAIEFGVDAGELDLHGTADSEIVVIHDATLDRTTDLHGRINETTLETIQSADAGGWFDAEFADESVPTLTEALACIAKKAIAVLEIKDPLIAEAVVAKIHETGTLDFTVVISFHTTVLQTIRALEPRIATGWLIGSHNKQVSPIELCQQLGQLGSSLLNVNHELITADFAYEIRRRGIALWCWTVDDIDRMGEMQTFGVQGITSNYPERFAMV